ncbi:MAG: hypothetical protein AAGF04_02570 [Chlamydiota bacterium]
MMKLLGLVARFRKEIAALKRENAAPREKLALNSKPPSTDQKNDKQKPEVVLKERKRFFSEVF